MFGKGFKYFIALVARNVQNFTILWLLLILRINHMRMYEMQKWEIYISIFFTPIELLHIKIFHSHIIHSLYNNFEKLALLENCISLMMLMQSANQKYGSCLHTWNYFYLDSYKFNKYWSIANWMPKLWKRMFLPRKSWLWNGISGNEALHYESTWFIVVILQALQI